MTQDKISPTICIGFYMGKIIVFLDYDGVICTLDAQARNKFDDVYHDMKCKTQRSMDYSCLSILHRIADEFPEVVFVCCSRVHGKDTREEQISTTLYNGKTLPFAQNYRTYDLEYTWYIYLYDQMLSGFASNPERFNVPPRRQWITFEHSEHKNKFRHARGPQILHWLMYGMVEGNNFLIIDDDIDAHQLFKDENYVHVLDGWIGGGITMKHYREIRDKLAHIRDNYLE